MSSEKLKILEMIQEGKITSEEGLDLLNALQETQMQQLETPVVMTGNRFLRVKVNGDGVGVKKIDVNIPLNLVKVASKFMGAGMNMIPYEARKQMEANGIDISQIDFDELIDLIDQGISDGKLVDIDVDDPEEGQIKVEIYVD